MTTRYMAEKSRWKVLRELLAGGKSTEGNEGHQTLGSSRAAWFEISSYSHLTRGSET